MAINAQDDDWDTCTAKTLQALLPNGVTGWTPAAGHEPASQRLHDMLQQPRQYAGDDSGGSRRSSGGTADAAPAVSASGRRWRPSAAALLQPLHGVSLRSVGARTMAVGERSRDAAAAEAAAAARKGADGVRAAIAAFSVRAAAGAGAGSGRSRNAVSGGGLAGQGGLVPLRVSGVGGRVPMPR